MHSLNLKHWKKKLSILLCILLCTTWVGGCAGDDNSSSQSSSESESSSAKSSDESTKDSDSNASSSLQDTSDANQNPTIQIGALKGPTAMGMVKLMEENEAQTSVNNYNFTIAGSADKLTPKLISGELDIAAVPANLSAVLYNNTNGQITVLAVNTLGVLYIVENGETVQSVEDLRGKTIYTSGKGATPDIALQHILSANQIDPATDVTIEYKSEHTEVVAALEQNPEAVAMLPQPFVTTASMQNESMRVALDMNEEWSKLENGNNLITGVLVARKEFVDAHKEAVDQFLEEYQSSTDYVNNNIEESAQLIEKFDIIKAAVAAKAIDKCNITFIAGNDMKEQLGVYLNILYEQNPQSVGGQLPDEEFYYVR